MTVAPDVPAVAPSGRNRVPCGCADPPVRESLGACSSASPPARAPRSHADLPRLGWGFLRLAAGGRGNLSLGCPGSRDGCFESCSMVTVQLPRPPYGVLNQERLLPFSAILGIFGASAISFFRPLTAHLLFAPHELRNCLSPRRRGTEDRRKKQSIPSQDLSARRPPERLRSMKRRRIDSSPGGRSSVAACIARSEASLTVASAVPAVAPSGRLRVPCRCADPPVRGSLAACSSASPPARAPRSHADLPRLGWGFLRLAAGGRGVRSLECPGSRDGGSEICSMKRRRIDSSPGGRSSVAACIARSAARTLQADHAPVGRREIKEPDTDRKARWAELRTSP